MSTPYWPDRPRILASFAYPLTVERALRVPSVDLMVDSGAFTAHTLGKKIDLQDYCDFLNANHSRITTAVVLDVIGDWRATARNHERMLELVRDDVQVLPVWHSTSPLTELERLCSTYPYIGIGGVVSMAKTVSRFMQHMIRAHQVARKHGTRLHGLGVTGQTAMIRLPWYSVDSSSFIAGARYGRTVLYTHRYQQTTVTAGERITDREALRLVRRYGQEPDRLAKPGFGRKVGGAGYQSEYMWMVEASARAHMHVEGHLYQRNRNDARVYLACAPTYAVDVVHKAHSLGSPFD